MTCTRRRRRRKPEPKITKLPEELISSVNYAHFYYACAGALVGFGTSTAVYVIVNRTVTTSWIMLVLVALLCSIVFSNLGRLFGDKVK